MSLLFSCARCTIPVEWRLELTVLLFGAEQLRVAGEQAIDVAQVPQARLAGRHYCGSCVS